jgi:glyoxylate/hydroxypyruvate reductase A
MSQSTPPVIVAYFSTDDPISYWQDTLQPLIPGIEIVDATSDKAQNAEVLMTWNPPEGMVVGLKSLKGVISLAQGVDHVLKGKTFPDHLKFARLIDPYMSEAMAEWAMLAVLEYHRDVEEYRAAEERHEWIRLRPNMAQKTTIAVLGLGAIGSHVAEKLASMRFNVIGWSRSAKSIPGVTAVSGDEGLEQCLVTADMLVSILPLTTETENMFNKDCFARMKKGAVFINSGRGRQVVEDDLIAALDQNHLKAATLDVMVTEPLPQEHPFWDHPKIRIWPHVSAQTNPESASEQVAKAIEDIRAGREPENSVNIKRGY